MLPGHALRTSLVGGLKARDGVPPPTAFFSGYTVGAAPEGPSN